MVRAIRPTIEPLEDKLLLSADPMRRLALIDEAVAHLDRQTQSAELIHANAISIASMPIASRLAVPPVVSSGFSLTLVTNRLSYKLGDPVMITYQATNVTSSPITVSRAPSLDGFAISKDGGLVWRSNSGSNPYYIIRQTIEPGRSLTLTAVWTASNTGTFQVVQQSTPVGGPTASFTVS